jgi:hypothetical protein
MNYNADSNLGIFPILVMLISLALNVLLTKHFAQKYNLSVRDDITED